MEEIWKDIKGYEGKYQVSSIGRVKSLKRTLSPGYYGKGRTKEEMLLRPFANQQGYLRV